MVSAHEPSPPLPTNPNRPEHLTDFGQFFSFFFHEFFVFLRNGDGHGNGYDHDCCGSTTTAITTLTMVTIAATWWLRPRLRQLGGYDHGNGYDHDCCGSTTTAITTLAMVTIAAAMATIAEPMSGLDPPSHLTSPGNQGGNARGNQGGPPYGPSTLTRRVRTL